MATMRLAKKTGVDITLISATDMFNEQVRNHQIAARQRVGQHPLADLLSGTRVRFLQGTVTALNLAGRCVTVQTETGSRDIGYDYLVYALGSHVRTANTPGAHDFAYTLDYSSALALAERLPEVAARGGRLLIVGGGNNGVETASEIAETYPRLNVTLVTRHSFAAMRPSQQKRPDVTLYGHYDERPRRRLCGCPAHWSSTPSHLDYHIMR